MPTDSTSPVYIPKLAGCNFRLFRGEQDFFLMLPVLLASLEADGIQRKISIEEMAESYAHLVDCDPYQDMILVNVAGELAAYGRTSLEVNLTSEIYRPLAYVAPEWRRKGIGRALLQWLEARSREIASLHLPGKEKFFQITADQKQEGRAILLVGSGYQPVRYFYEMVRPNLDEIPGWPLPQGIELRAALPEHYPAIWNSVDEASQDEWGYSVPAAGDYQAWLDDPHFQPHLWQIAWDTAAGQVAGHVLTFIDQQENEQYNRKRGYTEGIGVARSWRRRGLARAMIGRSLQAQKAAGMTESALAADADSTSGVIRLYESCGFQTVRQDTLYRKAL